MILDVWLVVSLISLGATVGLLAGLLGIGGGGVLVPVLASIFIAHGISTEHVMHLALGTSLASIVLTSISSMLAHHKRKGVLWSSVKQITPGIVVGVIGASVLINFIQTLWLAIFFAAFMAYVAAQIFIDTPPKAGRELPSAIMMSVFGVGLGLISTLVSIGGGTISVPFLLRHNIPINKAIGTSAALGFPIAMCGSAGYFILGHFFNSDNSEGYIYFPAVIIVSITSFIFVPLGVKLGYKLPVKILKKCFALLLLALSCKMILTVMG